MNEETWKDILACNEPEGFKPPHWCSVLVEVTIFFLVGIGAALLRFTDWAFLYQRDDFSLLCNDSYFNRKELPDDYTVIYYSICVGVPFLMIFVCEVERSYYSVHPSYKLFTGIQKFFYISLRPLGMFILGIFLVSVTTDYIKVMTTWPRPYFLLEHKQFCVDGFISSRDLTMEERFGLTSFPCHLSTISAFTGFLAACYIHHSISLNSAPLIKPVISTCLFLITISGSIYRVEIHYNHMIDVIGGIGIGCLFAYIVNKVLLQRHKAHSQIISESACKLLLPRVTLPKTASQISHNNHKELTTSLQTRIIR